MKIYVLQSSNEHEYERVMNEMLSEGWLIEWVTIGPDTDLYQYKAILKQYITHQIS